MKKKFQKKMNQTKKPKSWQVSIPQGTREGVTLFFAHNAANPSALCFLSSEFEQLLSQMHQPHNISLVSFFTAVFDGYLEEDCSKTNLHANSELRSVHDAALSFCGVSTEKGFFQQLPEKAIESGFLQRQAFYLGTDRCIDVPRLKPLDGWLEQRIYRTLSYLEQMSRKMTEEDFVLDFDLSPEADLYWDRIYRVLNKEVRLHKEQGGLAGSIRRDFCDYGLKFALIFQVFQQADEYLSLKGDPSVNIFLKDEANVISLESLKQGIAWAQYFIDTDIYVHKTYLDPDSASAFDTMQRRALEVLEKHKEGVSRTYLRREINANKKKSDTELFNLIIQDLREDNLIEILKKGKETKYKLKSYVLK